MRIGDYPALLYQGGDPALEPMDVYSEEEEAEALRLGFRRFMPGHQEPTDAVQIEEAQTAETRVKRAYRSKRNR